MIEKSILIVEDEESIRLCLEYHLSEKGFEVEPAESGEDAIKKLDMDDSYDLVITDLSMGEKSGVDVLKKIRETDKNTHVLIMSGFDSYTSIFKEAMKLKPCGHLSKPFSKEEILKEVRICLEGTG